MPLARMGILFIQSSSPNPAGAARQSGNRIQTEGREGNDPDAHRDFVCLLLFRTGIGSHGFSLYPFFPFDIPALKSIFHPVCIGTHSAGAVGRASLREASKKILYILLLISS
jgi:hypothetical protein